jgi:PAS domain S-box-containing protein
VPGLYLASEEVTDAELGRFVASVVSWPIGVRAVGVVHAGANLVVRGAWPESERDDVEQLTESEDRRLRAAIGEANDADDVVLFAASRDMGSENTPSLVFVSCAGSENASPDARRACATFVVVTVDGRVFAHHALGSFDDAVVDVALRVVESGGSLSPVVFRVGSEREPFAETDPPLATSQRIPVGASAVQIDLRAGARLAEYHRTLRAPLWLVAGLFATVLASSMAAALASRTTRLTHLVESRTRALGIVRAAHERGVAELRDTEERFRILVEGTRDHALLLLDPHGRVQSWNPGAERLFGWKESEILGRPVTTFDDDDGTLGHVLDLARTRHHMYSEGTAVRSDGSVLRAEHVVTSLRDDDGALRGFALVSRDVTERYRQDQEIRRLNTELEDRVRERTAELESANRELEAFSYSVSHDLRAPLRAIDGFARILEEDVGTSLGAEAARCIDTIRRSAKQMGTLIDDLLAFSRLTRQPLTRTLVDVRAMAREAFTAATHDCGARRIEFVLDELPPCRADAAMLKQVFGNLLSNAVKFTRPRDVAHVRVFAEPAPDGGTIYGVRDDGVGFDPAYASRLFGVFQRLHRQDEFEGTGVGLALVERIVTRHGGRVWAESEPGRGATFRFTLGRSNP